MTDGRVVGLPVAGDVLADKYRIEGVIGVGGMGAVLAARNLDLEERVAIKMLLPHVPTHGEPVARFLREARAAAKIRSDHVVRIFDVGRLDNGAPFIVMEHLEGGDLAQTTEARGPLPVEEAVTYVLQACEAIAAAHALGIVHRDLKPANLFLTTLPDGSARVKVLDFGISKVTGGDPSSSMGLTSTTSIMGTPAFMSPEQLRATRDVDARADVWALGAILYALLTGSPPYDGESNADVSAKIIRDEPPPLVVARPDAPPELAAVIRSCLEKDPAKRCASVTALVSALVPFGGAAGRAVESRVMRVAAGVTPTLKSSGGRDLRVPSAATGTATASAWGDTGAESGPKARSRMPLVLGAVALAAISVFGVLRIETRSTVAVSGVAVSAAGVGASIGAVGTATTAPAAPSAGAPPASSVGASASADALPRGKGAMPPTPHPSATAKPPTGLFDNRE